MNIAFHSNQLCIRGTEVALYDYALFNETLLGNTSYIFAKRINTHHNDELVISKFKKRFGNRVYLYDDFGEVELMIQVHNITHFYAIKAGFNDGIISRYAINLMHIVFDVNEPHGDKYIYISQWLSNKMSNGLIEYIPHIIELPKHNDDLREQLNIPKNSIVFGRHGGNDSFNIPYVYDVIKQCVNENSNIYFLFMNTDKFYEHERIIYLDRTENLNKKTEFINTCDAMIHASNVGESFGISICEFLFHDKPVITSSTPTTNMNHLLILKDRGIYYTSKNTLYNIFVNFKRDYNINYSELVKEFNPIDVMNKFNDIFLKE